MRPITFLVPDLGHSSHGKQVSLLAPHAKKSGRSVRVFSLAGRGPFAETLESKGITVEGHRGRRFFDIDDFLTLRRRLADMRLGVMHLFGLASLRAVRIAGVGVKKPEQTLTLTGREKFNRLDRRWLRSVERIEVPHAIARDTLIGAGVPATQLHVVPPKVGPAPPPPDRDELCRSIGSAFDAPLLMTAGQMRDHALYGAVWAFEFVRYPNPTARLLIAGDGPGREKIEDAAHGLAPEGTPDVFLGSRNDVPSLIGAADVVILPQPTGGANVALEAMAAGRAVIACQTPDFSAIIRHGETGMLIPIGHPAEIAKAAVRLMHDPARRKTLGDAARESIRDRIID